MSTMFVTFLQVGTNSCCKIVVTFYEIVSSATSGLICSFSHLLHVLKQSRELFTVVNSMCGCLKMAIPPIKFFQLMQIYLKSWKLSNCKIQCEAPDLSSHLICWLKIKNGANAQILLNFENKWKWLQCSWCYRQKWVTFYGIKLWS